MRLVTSSKNVSESNVASWAEDLVNASERWIKKPIDIEKNERHHILNKSVRSHENAHHTFGQRIIHQFASLLHWTIS